VGGAGQTGTNIMRPFSSDEEIAAIGRGLIDRTLPKADWTHARHFAATVWILARRADIAAERDMPGLIRAYNEATGVANTETAGYHHTITLASIAAARAFLGDHEGRLCDLCNDLLGSALGDPDWLLAYWSRATLFSTAARRFWVGPDRRGLPWPVTFESQAN
jgi:hypothetical protein